MTADDAEDIVRYERRKLFIADVNTIDIDFCFTCEKERRNLWCLYYKPAGPPPFDYCLYLHHYPIRHCSNGLKQISQLHWLIEKATERIVKLAMTEDD